MDFKNLNPLISDSLFIVVKITAAGLRKIAQLRAIDAGELGLFNNLINLVKSRIAQQRAMGIVLA